MMADITDFLNNCITEMYAHVKRDYNNTELQHLYKFDYQNNILTVKKMNIGEEIKIDHEFPEQHFDSKEDEYRRGNKD